MKRLFFAICILVFGVTVALATVPHTEDRGGVMHRTGGNDPFNNCAAAGCHGADLKGGTRGGSAMSCFDCHEAYW